MKPIKFYDIESVVGSATTNGTVASTSRLDEKIDGLTFHSISIATNSSSNESESIEKSHKPLDQFDKLDDVFRKTIRELAQKPVAKARNLNICVANLDNAQSARFQQPQLNPRIQERYSPLSSTSNESALPKTGLQRILVIEDDDVISGFLVHLLQQKNFSVRLATDGRQAVEMLDRIAPPDLIIMDVMLPFLNGFELLQRVRKTVTWKDVPVLMLSSKTQETDVIRAMDAGADDYVPKPFNSQELLARINRSLQ